MSFQIITGAAGAGKSSRLFQRIIASAQNVPERTHIVLVPEQATLQTEGRLVAMHPDHILFNIEVLSFNKLAYRLFDYENVGLPAFLDESGKSMLIRKAAESCKKQLTVYKDNIERTGVINHLKSAVSELLQYGVTPDKLEETEKNLSNSPLLSDKLIDLTVIFREYLTLKDQDSMSAEEIQLKAADLLERSDFLRGSMIAIDGFTGFTPVQLRIIACLMRRCLDLSVAVTLPEGEPQGLTDKYDLFSLTKKTIKSLTDTAQFYQIYPHIMSIPSAGSKQPADLAYLTAHFLRDDKANPFDGAMESVHITSCASPGDEAVYVADIIARLVREKGYRYRDFAVVSADLEANKTYLAKTFADAGIPAYIDVKKGIMQQPVSVFLLSAVEIVEKNYSFDTVFRFLRTGLADCTRDETDLLENYCLGTGINGRAKWSKPFIRAYKNHPNVDFEELNEIRIRAIGPVLRFHDRITAKGHTYNDACTALRELLRELNVETKLAYLGKQYEENGEVLEGRLYAQIFPCIDKLIGQIEAILGTQRYNLKELREMLKAGLSQLGIGSVPPVLDEVQTGDLRRSRRGQVKILFFINCTDDNLPKKEPGAGIFTDEQREKLAGMDLELAPTAKENSINERFYLYELFHQPEDQLYITYSRRNRMGETAVPSSYIPMVKALFKDPVLINFDSEKALLPENRVEAKHLLAASLRDIRQAKDPARVQQLYASFAGDPAERDFLRLVTDGAFFVKPDKRLSPESLKRLYPGNVDTSITRLERQAGCAYSAFLQYALGLKDRESFELNAADIGTIDHALIEAVIRELAGRKLDPEKIDDALCSSLTEDALRYIGEQYQDYMNDSDRDCYYIDRFRKVTEKNIRITLDQLAGSTFRPVATEAGFDGRNQEELIFPVNEEQNLVISGRIDRIDIAKGEDGQIARVIDYKTGDTKLDFNKVAYGLSLQLLVYLEAVKGMFRQGTQPGGAYYFNIKNPTVDAKIGEVDPEEIWNSVMSEMKLNGIQTDDASVEAADPNTKAEKLTPDQMDALRKHVRQEIIKLGRDLVEGRIDVYPARQQGTGSYSACRWCDFAGVCGFDDRLAGYRYRRIPKKKSEEIIKEITESGSDGTDN